MAGKGAFPLFVRARVVQARSNFAGVVAELPCRLIGSTYVTPGVSCLETGRSYPSPCTGRSLRFRFFDSAKWKCCARGAADIELVVARGEEDLLPKKEGKYDMSARHIRQLRVRGINPMTVCGLDADACALGVIFSFFDAYIRCHLEKGLCRGSSGHLTEWVQATNPGIR